MKRLIAAIAVGATLSVTALPAHADPIDDLRKRVGDFYNQKFGCDSGRPLICPGPPI